MEQSDPVTVYGFRTYAGHAELPELAAFKATAEAVRALGGEIVHGTEEKVARAELDREGRYRRQATGWGELT